jgi:hypothetical protein
MSLITNMLTSPTKQRDREDYLDMVSVFDVAVRLYQRTGTERAEKAALYFGELVEQAHEKINSDHTEADRIYLKVYKDLDELSNENSK